MSRKSNLKEKSSTRSDQLGLTTNGALVVLSLIKDTTDAFPPLKSTAAIAVGLLESVKVSVRYGMILEVIK